MINFSDLEKDIEFRTLATDLLVLHKPSGIALLVPTTAYPLRDKAMGTAQLVDHLMKLHVIGCSCGE